MLRESKERLFISDKIELYVVDLLIISFISAA